MMTTPINIVKKIIISLVGVALITLEAMEVAQAAVVTLNTSDNQFTPEVKNQGCGVHPHTVNPRSTTRVQCQKYCCNFRFM